MLGLDLEPSEECDAGGAYGGGGNTHASGELTRVRRWRLPPPAMRTRGGFTHDRDLYLALCYPCTRLRPAWTKCLAVSSSCIGSGRWLVKL